MWTIYAHELILAGIVAVIMVSGVVAIVWRDRRFGPERSTHVVLSDDERAVLFGAADAKTRQLQLARRTEKKKTKASRRGRDGHVADNAPPASEN